MEKMGKRMALVDVLTASGCGRCQQARALVKEVTEELADHAIQYREINAVEDIDYAVKLGVMSTPAIAINGELVFPVLPSATKLRRAILERLDGSR